MVSLGILLIITKLLIIIIIEDGIEIYKEKIGPASARSAEWLLWPCIIVFISLTSSKYRSTVYPQDLVCKTKFEYYMN